MKCSLVLLLLCLSLSAKSFDKDLKISREWTPLEFVLLFDSLKVEIKAPNEKIKFIGLIQELDQNLGFLKKDHVMLLMKSEVIKNVLEFKFPKVRQFDMTNLLINRLETDFESKQKYLNPFSKWIWRSIIAELNYRKSMGLISDKSFSPNNFEGAKRQEALRFQRYLNYLLPWIDRMDSLTSAQFNELTKEVSWDVLRKLNDRSILFKRYASTASGDTKVSLFNIPQKLLELHPEDIKKMRNDDAPMTLKEKSQIEKIDAQEGLQRISPDDMSPVSEDVIKEIEQKSE